MFEKEVRKFIKEKTKFSSDEILLERPRVDGQGDLSFPCFRIAGKLKKKPIDAAIEIASLLRKSLPPIIKRIDVLGGYVNFFFDDRLLAAQAIKEAIEGKQELKEIGKGKHIVIDFSSPNIAKPMSIGHLRSTIIGNSLCKIFSALGYKVTAINYLGDYGTQFGSLLAAYSMWGNEFKDELKKNPIQALLKLYIKFNAETEKNEKLKEYARAWFKKLENDDKKAQELWKQFRDLSLKEFKKFYKDLGVRFDVYSGESFFRKEAKKIIEEFKNKGIAVESAGAFIVDLKKYGMTTPLLLEKSDGTTLYSTRDIAATVENYKKYKFDKIIFVVGTDQNLHFKQLFKTFEIAGYPFAKKCVHVNFGLIYMPTGRLSTRKGEIVFLEEVFDKIIALARDIVKNEKMSEKEKNEIAKAVGISALIYSDLSNDRIKDISFDWKKMLMLEGDSGPYLQYTYARASSILRKAKARKIDESSYVLLNSKEELALIRHLGNFSSAVEDSASHYSPHIIANYASKLAELFNTFYAVCPVLSADENTKEARLVVVSAVKQVMGQCMNLLGMHVLERM